MAKLKLLVVGKVGMKSSYTFKNGDSGRTLYGTILLLNSR